MAKTPVTTLRLNAQLRAALEADAERQHRTLSNMIETILFEHYAKSDTPVTAKPATGRRPNVGKAA